MKRRNAIKFRGERFASLKDLAARFDAHYGNLVRRLNAGWSTSQALGLSRAPGRNAHNAVNLDTSIGKFSSARDAARATGIKEATIVARLARGWSPDQAVGAQSPPKRNPKIGRSVVCEGRKFQSVSSFADFYRQNRIRTRKRLDSGWSPEQAVGLEPRPPRYRDQSGAARDHAWTDKQVLEDGSILPRTEQGHYRLYLIRDARSAKEYVGITTSGLKDRLRGHWRSVKTGRRSKIHNAMRKALAEGRRKEFKIELLRNDARDFRELQLQEIQAIKERDTIGRGFNTSEGGSIGTSKPTVVDGKLFPSRQAAAEHFGVPAYKFNLRLSRLGYSPEEAAGLVERKGAWLEVVVRGKRYSSFAKVADHFGIPHKTAYARFRVYGWSLEQALGLRPPPFKRPPINSKVLNTSIGKFYSISEAARRTGLKSGTIASRLRAGWTHDEAVGATPPRANSQRNGSAHGSRTRKKRD